MEKEKDEKEEKQPEQGKEDVLGFAYAEPKLNVPRYTATFRPINHMKTMCTKEAKICPSDVKFYLPVNRYKNLMYHSERDELDDELEKAFASVEKKDEKKDSSRTQYCGKFYYIEPQSNVVLDMGTVVIFASKVHAWYKFKEILSLSQDHLDLELFERMTRKGPNAGGWIWALENIMNPLKKEQLSEEQKLEFTRKYIKPYYFALFNDEKEVDNSYIEELGTNSLYPNKVVREEKWGKKFYAKYWSERNFGTAMHDDFDQDICEMAREYEIDTVIFQHEPGSKRAVSEILDTRPDTYQHLVRITNRNFIERPWYKWSTIYPTIWFVKKDGFLVNSQCCIDFEFEDAEFNPLNIVTGPQKDLKTLQVMMKIVKAKLKQQPDQGSENELTASYGDPEQKIPRYPSTLRPINHMLKMCSKESKTCPSRVKFYLPVNRYLGLYYNPEATTLDKEKQEKKDKCGTFYYIEPQSNVVLDLGNVAVFASRVQAWYVLAKASTSKLGEDDMDKWLFDMITSLWGASGWKKALSEIIKIQMKTTSHKQEIKKSTLFNFTKKQEQLDFTRRYIKPYLFTLFNWPYDVNASFIPELGITSLYPYKFQDKEGKTIEPKYWDKKICQSECTINLINWFVN